MAAKIHKAKFSRVCGEKVYNTIWIPRLRYVAPVVCFTKSQCSKIDKKVVRQCLGAVGFNRNFPRAVVFGPQRLGGMGWDTMSSLQIYEKVKFTLAHLRKQDKIGNMLRLSVAIIQLSAGIQDDILASKVLWTKWVETSWISNLKQWLDEINAALHINYSSPKPQRQYDRALMDIFSTWGMSAREMKALNRVRIYLRVFYVSDVTTYDGTTIEPQALEVTKIRDSSLVWPRQIKPARSDRKLWSRCLARLCMGKTLITTLGRWKCRSHQLWKYMISDSTAGLLRLYGGVQYIMPKIYDGVYGKVGLELCTPLTGIPVRCAVMVTTLRLLEDDFTRIPTVTPRPIIGKTCNKAENETLGFVRVHNEGSLSERWKIGDTWMIGTDGGLKHGIGSCGITFHSRVLNKELILCRMQRGVLSIIFTQHEKNSKPF